MNEWPEKEKLTSSCQTKVTLSLLILFFNVQKVSDEGTVKEQWGNGVQSSCLKYRCIHDNMFLFWPTEFIVFCCFNIIKILIFTGPTFFMCMCDFKSRLYVISTFISFLQLLSETRDTMFLWGWFTADSRLQNSYWGKQIHTSVNWNPAFPLSLCWSSLLQGRKYSCFNLCHLF